MTNKTFYNEILIDHNMHPGHKHDLDDANMVMEGLNPTCGDHIWLKLKVEDGVIVDGSFVGEGCAVSQASADMMRDLISTLFGSYTPPTYTETVGEVTREVIPAGAAGVDWTYVLGVLAFLLVLYCILRIFGAVISR